MLDGLVQLRLVRKWHDAALVVRARALVRDHREAVPLQVCDGRDGCIDGDLQVVHAETVTIPSRSLINLRRG